VEWVGALGRLRICRILLHGCSARRADALMDLCDAVLTAGSLPSQAHASLEAGGYDGGGGYAPGPCGLPRADQVVIYQHATFGGNCEVLGPGAYAHSDAFGKVGNDAISSIVVGRDVSATLYQNANFGGSQLTLPAGNYARLADRGFNDRTSSMRVQRR
jgi:hypothetical protein